MPKHGGAWARNLQLTALAADEVGSKNREYNPSILQGQTLLVQKRLLRGLKANA